MSNKRAQRPMGGLPFLTFEVALRANAARVASGEPINVVALGGLSLPVPPGSEELLRGAYAYAATTGALVADLIGLRTDELVARYRCKSDGPEPPATEPDGLDPWRLVAVARAVVVRTESGKCRQPLEDMPLDEFAALLSHADVPLLMRHVSEVMASAANGTTMAMRTASRAELPDMVSQAFASGAEKLVIIGPDGKPVTLTKEQYERDNPPGQCDVPATPGLHDDQDGAH